MKSRSVLRAVAIASAAAAAIALSACSASTPEDAAAGDDSGLQTVTPGKFTIATGEPAYSPWVEDDDPESGEGFEAAVAYAVADQLGFEKSDVVWIRTPFDTVIAPGPKDFDINIQQFSANEDREKAVDFSSPYYETTQGVVSVEGSPAADATSLADLADVKVGVAAGSTSIAAVKEAIGTDPAIFNSNEDTVQALIAGNIDALVTDLPTAFYNANAVLDNGVLVGQFESSAGGDKLALLLENDSPLTDPVTEAVDALREDGTLDELAEKWLADNAGATVLS
ncbi:ABC transporter substrate-binding protein [Paramicrobacterium agarici]|uniref:ABC transporter substrate-binding protein n=1 Tax=Paramicrobacterium agarici TaxID=630514 RepID=UPI001154B391|nr:ABC transporter substrate-binding protein [Microbacterium agarici]TQO21935.1 amino acid ABC transporter substrate-binding protein (PAAT family) [Microbacterium agarici]